MANRREAAFQALCVADDAARKAHGAFVREMEMAINSGAAMPPEPWALCVDLFKGMREAQSKRNSAYSAFGAVITIGNPEDDTTQTDNTSE